VESEIKKGNGNGWKGRFWSVFSPQIKFLHQKGCKDWGKGNKSASENGNNLLVFHPFWRFFRKWGAPPPRQTQRYSQQTQRISPQTQLSPNKHSELAGKHSGGIDGHS